MEGPPAGTQEGARSLGRDLEKGSLLRWRLLTTPLPLRPWAAALSSLVLLPRLGRILLAAGPPAGWSSFSHRNWIG